jgi:glycosyltransferase involved in cell wall biosynthesis
MACGLPVITTDVGGNKEVVNDADLGTVVPFGEAQALTAALKDALQKNWDKNNIINYAKNNAWQKRVDKLVNEFNQLVSKTA